MNLFIEPEMQSQVPALLQRVEAIRKEAIDLCCGEDARCQAGMERVQVSICKPQGDPNEPDPCVFGGSYRMAGEGYAAVFREIYKYTSSRPDLEHLSAIALKNLPQEVSHSESQERQELLGGDIVLSSYVPKVAGIQALDPVIQHEFGHACSMVRMQNAALNLDGEKNFGKASRAVQWLDLAKHRCRTDSKVPEAYDDFWEEIGESRELSQCFRRLAEANQNQEVDRPCEGLCPGHYVEEAVGIAFSALLGKLDGSPSATFPNTCHHVRDGQHPMVSDVLECMAQYSSRFRRRMAQAQGC